MFFRNILNHDCWADWVELDGKHVLRVEIDTGANIVDHLGTVQMKNDGRFTWIIRGLRSSFFEAPTGQVQGVTETLEQAKAKVEQAWITSTRSMK